MLGDLGLDQRFAVRPERIKCTHLVLAHEAAVADHIGGQNCGKSALDILSHGYAPLEGLPEKEGTTSSAWESMASPDGGLVV